MNSIVKLTKISQLLYFFILMAFLAFAYVYQYSNDLGIHKNILIIFTLLLFPLFDQIFELFRQEMKKYKIQSIGGVLSNVVLPVSGIVFLFLYLGFWALIVSAMIFTIYKKGDGRIFFASALVLFCYIAMYLVFGQDVQAEAFSVHAFYLLVSGVIVQFAQFFRIPKIKIS